MLVIDFLNDYTLALLELTWEMAPYLLLGFLIAGILHVYFPKDKVTRYLGRNNFSSVFNASILGIPLPLCSCGVIPTGISFYKNGASKGSSVSFLISTPQTGVDSIFATYALLGLPLALIRPVIALFTGIMGGLATNFAVRKDPPPKAEKIIETGNHINGRGSFARMMHYAFVEFLQDIAKWLVIGLLLAALFAVLIPDDFFSEYLGNEFLGMLLILGASIPIYVCATGSVPIAAVLLMKGLSPGAAIVFLMAGPATNAATITVIGNVLGKKTLYAYLLSIIGGALLFGVLVNEFLPREWFQPHYHIGHEGHGTHFLPEWLKVGSGLILMALVANGYIQRFIVSRKLVRQTTETKQEISTSATMDEKVIKVNGMTCNHCAMNIQKNLGALEGIETIDVDLQGARVKITGSTIDLGKVKEKVESIGYEYAGETQ